MRALSKLINLNNPDLVLFVGEALVGNDAVDQLSKFNQVHVLFPLSACRAPLKLNLEGSHISRCFYVVWCCIVVSAN